MSARSQGGTTRIPKPAYAEVEEILRMSIIDGKYEIGSQLPSETELAAKFSVSRFTIREALRKLSTAGMISRQQGARSRVIRTKYSAGYTFEVGSAEDLQQYASHTYFDIISTTQVRATASLARFLQCRDGREWILLKGARREMSSSDIVGYTEVYLWREFESHLDQILKRGEPIHKQIDSVLGIEAGDIVQNISAITMPAEAASVLGADLNSPALEIVRHYSGSNGRSFEVARSIHSAKDYRYSQVFRRYPNLPPS